MQRRLFIARQQVSRIAVNRNAARMTQLRLRPATAQQADRGQIGLSCSRCVIRCIPNDNDFVGRNATQLLQRSLKNIRARLGVFNVVGCGFGLDQIINLGDYFVSFQLGLLC